MTPKPFPPSFDPGGLGSRPKHVPRPGEHKLSPPKTPKTDYSGVEHSGAEYSRAERPKTPRSSGMGNATPGRRSVYRQGSHQPTPQHPQRNTVPVPPAYAPKQPREHPNTLHYDSQHSPVSPQRNIPRAGKSRQINNVTWYNKSRHPRKKKRLTVSVLTVLLTILVAWPTWLMIHTNQSLNRVEALSETPTTPGTTYVFAGSDSREGWNPDDPTMGERSDSVILIHKATNGQTALVSMPRDLYVEIPGYGMNKLNAAFAFGGPQLLVVTLQNLTGLAIDHYVQIGMGGVNEIVDALGGVELCWDYDVFDEMSGMDWVAGCHHVNGTEALSFSRMRYSDPTGDVGRTLRQRQLLNVIASKTVSPSTLLNPFQQYNLSTAAANALTVGQGTNIWDVGFLLLAMRSAGGNGLSGQPPISSYNTMNEVGSVMLLDETRAPNFFNALSNGTLTVEDFALPYE